jgi:hypothetical protein
MADNTWFKSGSVLVVLLLYPSHEAVSLIFLLQFLLQAFLQMVILTSKSKTFSTVVEAIISKSIHPIFCFRHVYIGSQIGLSNQGL